VADAAPKKRQEIIAKAYEAFYAGGFHATGVDAVMADSGISKRTLYKYFPSKEELIEAVLEHYGDGVEACLFTPAKQRAGDPLAQIQAIFDIKREMMEETGFQGCLAMRAAQEFAGRCGPIEARGREAGLYIQQRFTALCAEAGLADADALGRELTNIFQGAVLVSQVRRNTEAFDAARVTVAARLAG
jgi:AcrR family transcriptional regulator